MKTVDEKLVLELPALIKAISFGEQWAMNGIEVCAHAGFTATERQLQKVYHYIIDNSGITRSKVMQFFRLSSKEAELLIDTLDQRGLIVRKREGRGEKLWMPSDAYGK